MSGTLIPLMGTAVDAIKPLQQWQNVLKTEADRYKTQAETGTERERPALVRAQTGEAGARTGLIGAQTVGAQIQNELSKLMLGYRGQFGNALSGTSYGDQGASAAGMPWATGAAGGGGGAGTGVDLVTPGGGGGGVPGNALSQYGTSTEPATAADVGTPELDAAMARLRAGQGAGGASAPDAGAAAAPGAVGPQGGAPALPQAGGVAPAQGGGAAGGWASGMSPNGVLVPGVGVPLPRLQAASIALAADPGKAINEAMQNRRQALAQLASGATDGPSWNMAIRQAWEQGYITNGDVAHLWNHPEYQDAMVRSLSNPEAQVGYQGSLAGHGATPGPTGPVANPALLSTRPPVTIDVLGPDGKVHKQTIPAPAYVAGVGAPGGTAAAAGAAPAPAAATGGAMPGQQWAAMVNGQENGTGNPAARNPRSSASGNGQFLDDTWLHTIKQARPDLAAGRSDTDLLAMRADPNLSQDMTAALARENAPVLAQQGIPVNASTLRLAHWFGPQGAANIFHGNQDAPIASLVSPKVLAANPDLRGQTVRSLVQPVVARFGLGPVDLSAATGGSLLGGGAAPAAAPALAAAANAIGSPTATGPLLPGAIPGPVTLTPEGQAELDIKKQQQEALQSAAAKEQGGEAEAYGEQSKNIITAAAGAQQKFERLDVLQNAADQFFRPGQTAELRKAALTRLTDALQTVGVKPPDWMLKGATGAEVIEKEGGYLAAEMTKALGSREAASVFHQIRNIQPNLTLSTGGFNAIIQSIRQGVQRDSDLGTFREKWVADPAHNGSIRGMVDAFNAAHPVEAYASRIMPYPMPAKQDQLKPNVIYSTAPGSAARKAGTSAVIWDGSRFQPIM